MNAAPRPTAIAIATAAASAGRNRRARFVDGCGSARTRSRSPSGADGAAARSSRTTLWDLDSDIVHHPLLELLERPAQAGRDRGRPDPEHARRGLAVELEHDAQHDDLPLRR